VHKMRRSERRVRAVALGAMLMATFSSMADSESSSEDWKFGLLIYGWLPDVSGDLNYAPPGGGDSIEVDASNIIDNLKMTFMGSFEARKGKWSGFTDVLYLNLGDHTSKSVTLPDGATGTVYDASLDLKGLVWTLAGAYTAWRKENSYLDLLAGARLLSLDTEVNLTGGGPGKLDVVLSEDVNLWDGIIGAKGTLALKEHWFVPYYLDMGTGNTDFTWQASVGIGYAFKWGDIRLNYRHLEYDQGSDELLQDIAFSGPQLGVGFRF